MSHFTRSRFALDVVATVAAVCGCGLLAYLSWGSLGARGSNTPAVPAAPVSLEGATRKGSAAAPVVLIEYTDYRCSFCAKEERDALPEITRKYVDAGQVELAVRHHPLENLHPGATALAVAALCAGQQNRFWEMHQALFENHTDTSEELIMRLAHRLLVDDAKFSACLSTQVRDQVQHDVKEAEQLGLKGTPTFLVGYREVDGRVKVVAVINGAQPVEAFARAFEKAAAR